MCLLKSDSDQSVDILVDNMAAESNFYADFGETHP